MMENSIYYKKAELVIKTLGVINQFNDFALKGGTAINFFIRNLPRISVDIDLSYLPLDEREISLNNISSRLKQIEAKLAETIPDLKITRKQIESKYIAGLIISQNEIPVKIEPNLIIRGCVYPCRILKMTAEAEKQFNMSVEMQILSFEDLYAGKICAALDRQHPRDLFDIKLLLENEGISEKTKNAFIIYLLSHNRPISELLAPRFINLKDIYEKEFTGISRETVTLKELESARENLIQIILGLLTGKDKEFILSFKTGEPEWSFFSLKGMQDLPAIKWKLYNIKRMPDKKREKALEKLKKCLGK